MLNEANFQKLMQEDPEMFQMLKKDPNHLMNLAKNAAVVNCDEDL